MASQIDVKAVITAEDRASSVISDFGSNTRKATTVIAAAMATAGAGLTLFTKNATDYTVQLTKNTKELGRETGLSAESASALLYVTGRLGISAEQATQVFGIFSKKIAETASSTDASKTALGALGIQVKDAQGYTKNFNDILLQTADVFAKMPDGPQKTADALELFGRSGKDLLPVLNLGAQGIKDMETQAQKLGLTLTTENVASVSKYIIATKNLTDSQNALKVQIGLLTAPVLASFDQKLADVTSKVISATGPFKGLAAGAIALGGPVLSAGGAILGFTANIEQSLPIIVGFGRAIQGAMPWLLGITAAIGVGSIAWKIWKGRTENAGEASDKAQEAQQRMNTTLRNQVTTLDDVNRALDEYTRNQEDVTGAQLGVEQAQKDYNTAVSDYGANSLQAREALHQVKEANFQLKDATDKAAVSQSTLTQKQNDMIVQAPSAAAAVDLVAAHINGITLQSDVAISHVANLSLRVGQTLSQSLNAASVIQNTFSGLQGAANTVQIAVNGAQQTANNLQTTISNLNTSGSRGIQLNVSSGGAGIPLRAEGGPVTAGQPYWVGEEGIPELFVPDQSGSIVPMDKMSSSGGRASAPISNGGSGSTIVNITVQAGAFMGNPQDARAYAKLILGALQDVASSKGMNFDALWRHNGVRSI